VQADCEAWGIDPDLYAARDERIGVLAENVEAVNAWLTVQTQMRPEGLRYEGVRAALAMARIRVTPELFAALRTMEAAALEVWAERNG